MLYFVLRFVHIAAMAAWFGAGLTLAGDVRRTVALGPPHLAPLEGRIKRTGAIAAGAGWTTILTGFALIFTLGGFKAVSPAIHTAILVGLAMIGVGIAMGRTASAAVAQTADPAARDALVRRLSMLSGIFQLLWVVALGLMVLRALI